MSPHMAKAAGTAAWVVERPKGAQSKDLDAACNEMRMPPSGFALNAM